MHNKANNLKLQDKINIFFKKKLEDKGFTINTSQYANNKPPYIQIYFDFHLRVLKFSKQEKKREIRISKDFIVTEGYEELYKKLYEDIKSGKDITQYLSNERNKNIKKVIKKFTITITKKDPITNELIEEENEEKRKVIYRGISIDKILCLYGIYHFHFKKNKKRTEELLFVYENQSVFYLLGIFSHDIFNDKEKLIKIILKNWPDLLIKINNVKEPNITKEEKTKEEKELKKEAAYDKMCNTSITLDGINYHPSNPMMLQGYSLESRYRTDNIIKEINIIREIMTDNFKLLTLEFFSLIESKIDLNEYKMSSLIPTNNTIDTIISYFLYNKIIKTGFKYFFILKDNNCKDNSKLLIIFYFPKTNNIFKYKITYKKKKKSIKIHNEIIYLNVNCHNKKLI